MRLGFEVALEDEIVSGDGSTSGGADRMIGALETSGIQVQVFDTDRFTTARKAITLLETINLTPTAWVMSPEEWEAFELEASDEA